jgi:hypothetical protein
MTSSIHRKLRRSRLVELHEPIPLRAKIGVAVAIIWVIVFIAFIGTMVVKTATIDPRYTPAWLTALGYHP